MVGILSESSEGSVSRSVGDDDSSLFSNSDAFSIHSVQEPLFKGSFIVHAKRDAMLW